MSTAGAPLLTPAQRALLQQRLRGGRARPEPPIGADRRGPRPQAAPLSVPQEQLWYLTQLVPDNPVYNEGVIVHRRGSFDMAAFRDAFSELLRRHEIWRSSFEVRGGEPVQVVHPAAPCDVEFADLSDLSPERAERAATRLFLEARKRPYRLDRGPLVRVMVARFGPTYHRIQLALHHLVFDGYSLYRVALPELAALYDARVGGRTAALEEPAVQYADYAEWSLRWVRSEEFRRRVQYWRRALEGSVPLQFPLDHPRPREPRFRGAMEPVAIGRDLVGRLRAVSQEAGVTLFQTLASAFALLLRAYSGQDDVVFGTLTDIRQRPELATMIGYCLTPLVVRLDLGGDPLVSEVLGRCRDTLLAGMDHSVPFERLVREIAPHREAGTNPIFQAMLVLEPPPMAPDPGWELNQVDVAVGGGAGTAKFDLHIQLEERLDGRIDGQLIYDTDLIDRDTGRRLAAHWRSLLRTIAGGHERRVSEISVLGAKERHRQLYEWNATDEPIPAGTIHALVADQARRTPDAVAAISGAEQITFARLEARAGALAGRLCRAGAAPGVLVAVAMEPSIDALVGLLAILKTGAAYLPLDLRHPTARLAFILEDAAAGILLLHSRDRGRLPHPPGTVLCVDDAVPAGAPDGEIDVEVPPDAIAYVIYTSGSTGRPKGVQVTHAAVVNLLASMAGQLHLTGHDVVVALTTQAFDIHVVETWLPLASGARIAIAPRETASDGRLLASFIDTVQATLVQATPPTWRMLLDAGWAGRDGLVAISGGETLRPELAEALLTRVDSLWNMYGPTEATVYATRARVVSGQAVTIGTPLANTRAYILDPRGEPVPVGAHGELCLGGAGVAPGYLHRPLLTAERFLADPFRPGERMYRTGDRARFLADGRIEHLGRLDQQVKIRGFRVEPGEVESELVAHPALSASVVVAADHGGGVRLVAYVVPRGDAVPAAAELRATLRDRLPDHMIPAEFVVVDHLPLNANGKLDRAALPPPRGQEGEVDAGDEPGSELERRLALLWAAGLGLPRVGVHDDFFELGGHSLLAVRLLVEVERTLGAVIPLSTLFGSGATVAGMAAWIEGSGFAVRRQATETVVPVREDGAGPILFFVHPDESALLSLRHFTGPLGGEQRLIGLLPERVDGHFDPSRDVMDLARPMLEAIRRLQPEGPYLLAGYSLGGLLAYQIAGELRDAGSRVAWLGILDAVPQKAVRRYLRSQLRAQRGERLARLARLGPQGAVRKIAERTQHRARLLAGGPGVPGEPDPLFEGFDWHGALRLASGYACSGHDIPMQLFATETLMTATGSGSLGWDEVHRGRVTVHRVPGEHLTMMMEPHVEAVADRLSRSLHHAVGRRSESAA